MGSDLTTRKAACFGSFTIHTAKLNATGPDRPGPEAVRLDVSVPDEFLGFLKALEEHTVDALRRAP